MSYLVSAFIGLLKILGKFSKILPAGMAGLFIIFQFFVDLFTDGISFAFANLSTQLFAAEFTINKAVTLAIQNSEKYDVSAFLSIISSLVVIFIFIKFTGKLFVKIAGAQAVWGAYLMATMFLAILEISVIKIVDGSFGFVPIKDGIWFLAIHLQPVLSNIHFF